MFYTYRWGVELGKQLANKVRTQLVAARSSGGGEVTGFNPSTTALLNKYLHTVAAAAGHK